MNSFLYNILSRYFNGYTKKHMNQSNDTLNVINIDHNKESIEYLDNYLLSKEVDLPKRNKAKNALSELKQRFMLFSLFYGFKTYGSLIKSAIIKKENNSLMFNYNFV